MGIQFTGWELPPEESLIACFIQKRNAGSHFLAGEIADCFLSNNECGTVLSLGTLEEAAIALSYLNNVLNISIEQAAEELQAVADFAEAETKADMAMSDALNQGNWVDQLDPCLQDFADQFECEEDFDEYMEGRC